MNIKKIKELIELMNDNGLCEIEVEIEGMKVKLSKRGQGVVDQIISPVPDSQRAIPQNATEIVQEEKQSNTKEINSPMVGTFYRSPSPDSDAFVEIGDLIQKGDVICIIEAMKLMNEVKAEISGKIVEILIDNADSVEFGQAMFLIGPA